MKYLRTFLIVTLAILLVEFLRRVDPVIGTAVTIGATIALAQYSLDKV